MGQLFKSRSVETEDALRALSTDTETTDLTSAGEGSDCDEDDVGFEAGNESCLSFQTLTLVLELALN